MKTAEEILKDCLGDIRFNLNGSVTNGQIIHAMEMYLLQASHPTTLPSDEEIRESLKYNSALQYDKEREYALIGAKWMRSLCEAKIAEMEREKPSLQDRLFSLANDFAVAQQGNIAVRLHSIHNSITTTP